MLSYEKTKKQYSKENSLIDDNHVKERHTRFSWDSNNQYFAISLSIFLYKVIDLWRSY